MLSEKSMRRISGSSSGLTPTYWLQCSEDIINVILLLSETTERMWCLVPRGGRRGCGSLGYGVGFNQDHPPPPPAFSAIKGGVNSV